MGKCPACNQPWETRGHPGMACNPKRRVLPHEQMVERVARAIRDEDREGLVAKSWGEIDEYWRERYRKKARAAITALAAGDVREGGE